MLTIIKVSTVDDAANVSGKNPSAAKYDQEPEPLLIIIIIEITF